MLFAVVAICCAAATLTFVTVCGAVAAPGAENEVTGTLETGHFDSERKSGTAGVFHYLKTKSGKRLTLRFRGQGAQRFARRVAEQPDHYSGRSLTIAGAPGSTGFNVSSVEVGNGGGGSGAASTGPGPRKVAVLMFHFRGDTNVATPETARERVFTAPRSANALYKEMTNGQFSLVGEDRPDGDVLGPYEIPFDIPTDGVCRHPEWSAAADQLAEADGHDIDAYDYVIYYGSTGCNSHAPVGGNWAALYGTGMRVDFVVHELGHAFGLSHANRLSCADAGGEPEVISDRCRPIDYGDAASPMGSGLTHYNGWEKARLTSLFGVPFMSGLTKTVTSSSLELISPSEPGFGGNQAIRVPIANGDYYYLDYRQPFGTLFDVWPLNGNDVSGVTARIAPDPSVGTSPLRLETLPQISDSTLTAGRVLRDEQHRIAVTTLGVSTSGAVVDINVGLGSRPVRVGASGDFVSVDGGVGNASNITVTKSGPDYTVTDVNNPVYPLQNCSTVTSNQVRCSLPGQFRPAVVVDAGDRDDQVQIDSSAAATVFGGDGRDTLTGGPLWDTLYGGPGVDDIDGRAEDDTLYGGADGDTVRGGAGRDRLDGGFGADDLIGGSERDYVVYEGRDSGVQVTLDGTADDGSADDANGSRRDYVAEIENVLGSQGNDTLLGDGGANVLLAQGGDDVVDGGLGADDIGGGEGNDHVSYASRMEGVNVSADNVRNDGSAGDGGNQDSVLSDVEGLIGGSGNDTLAGAVPAPDQPRPNYFYGGAGSDLVSYAASPGAVTATLDEQINDGQAGENDFLAGDIEQIVGSGGDDDLVGSAQSNALFGGGGRDDINGGAGFDLVEGGANDDRIDGGSDNDWVIDLGGGDDHLLGRSGVDLLLGGTGADDLSGGAGSGDVALYGDHTQSVNVSVDNAPNDGSSGENDNVATDVEGVIGGSGNDSFTGPQNSPNMFSGGPGVADHVDYSASSGAVKVTLDNQANDGRSNGAEADDVRSDVENVTGTGFADSISGSSVTNGLVGGGGADTLHGNGGTDWLFGGDGNDAIFGEAGTDLMSGDSGNDQLRGMEDSDFYLGGLGADTLGDDWIYPGTGDDTFNVYESPAARDTILTCGTGSDWVIRDGADPTTAANCEQFKLGP